MLVHPVEKGTGSIFKRLKTGQLVILGLIVITLILSLVKQLRDNKEATAKESENEYLKLRPVQIGPSFLLVVRFKDSILLNSNSKIRTQEIARAAKISPDLNSLFHEMYMDSLSRLSMLKIISQVDKDNTFFRLDWSTGLLYGGFYMIQDGLLQSAFSVYSSKTKDSGIDSKDDKYLRYYSNKLVISGDFDTTINGGTLYQSISDEIKNKKNNSSISFMLKKDPSDDDINDMVKSINNIKSIQFLIETDIDASRYFVVELEPSIKYSKTKSKSETVITFPLNYKSLPSEKPVDLDLSFE